MIQSQQPRFNRFDRFVAIFASVLTLLLLALGMWPIASADSPEVLRFLGRLHPLLVHLPIGFLLALLVLEAVDLLMRGAVLHHATCILAWLAAGAAVFAVVAGALLGTPETYAGDLLGWHRWLGVLTAVAIVWILAWKIIRPPSRSHGWSFAYHPLLAVAAALLAGAGHYGGSLTHGSGYLVDAMPAGLRSLFGLPERELRPDLAIPDDPRDAVVFTTLIQPILEARCVSCHGAERQKAKLRLDAFERILEGGESGPDLNLIATSLQLPLEDDRHMPPKDKPQLTADEIALVTWWIQNGGSAEGKVRDFRTTGSIERILAARLDVADEEEVLPMKAWEEIEPAVRELNGKLGLDIRRIARDAPGLEIPFLPMNVSLGDAELALLAPLQANIQVLNLHRTAVTDQGLAFIAPMKNLTRLDLSQTAITDAGLAHLSELPRLNYLNLYGTGVTDEGLAHLHGLSNLRRIFLWQTGATREGVAQLERSLSDDVQVEAWQAEIRHLEQLIESARVRVDLGGAGDPESAKPGEP